MMERFFHRLIAATRDITITLLKGKALFKVHTETRLKISHSLMLHWFG